MSPRPRVLPRALPALASLALIGAATPAHADGVLYTTQETVRVQAPDPFFAQPRVRVGIAQGFQFGHGGVRPHTSVGVGFGVQSPARVDRFDLEQAARREAGQAVARVKQRLRSVSGVVVGAAIDDLGSGRDGFHLVASARAQIVFLTPEPLPITHPLAGRVSRVKASVDLRLAVRGAALPVTAREVERLYRAPAAERGTVLGGLLRQTWRQALGADADRGSKGELFLEAVAGQTLVGRYELPSVDAALGRPGLVKRLLGRDNELPELELELSRVLTKAQLRAEQLEHAGRPRARELLERLRAGEQARIGDAERAALLKLAGD